MWLCRKVLGYYKTNMLTLTEPCSKFVTNSRRCEFSCQQWKTRVATNDVFLMFLVFTWNESNIFRTSHWCPLKLVVPKFRKNQGWQSWFKLLSGLKFLSVNTCIIQKRVNSFAMQCWFLYEANFYRKVFPNKL